MAQADPWPRLDAAPIVEVMCGIFFAPQADLDPMFVGGWQRTVMSEDYGRHAIMPAVVESGRFFTPGVGPLRSWLISENDEWVLQVQPDRFYVNWRRRKAEYPRFSGPDGVLEKAVFELDRFRAYCRQHLKSDLALSTVELAKVDLIAQGPHWKDTTDLGAVVPLIADVTKFARSPTVELALNLVDPGPGGRISQVVGLSLTTEDVPGIGLTRAVKIETRCTCQLEASDNAAIRARFAELNQQANAAFFGLIQHGELGRFKKGS